jgi:hypothetical protein
MGTKAQTDFLADFWEKELGETEVSPTKASTIQNKLG